MKKIFAETRDAWRSWLEQNHSLEKEIWLVYYKKGTGKPSITYPDSVEEAICFGWIDGLKKTIDDETYTHRFSPRRKGSKWSSLNIQYAKKMIDAGKMMEAGLEAFNQKVVYDPETLSMKAAKEISLTPEIENALRENKTAWENFNNLALSYKKQYIGWLVSAKKAETRERRLKEAIRLLAKNQKLGMK